jgi:hypothetical protein
MHINQRSIAQKIKSRISGGISREIRGLDIKKGPKCKDFNRWKGIVMILERSGFFL